MPGASRRGQVARTPSARFADRAAALMVDSPSGSGMSTLDGGPG